VGQFQWVQAIAQDTTFVARIGTQLTPDSLLPLEQFSIGGVETVRGYRQSRFLGRLDYGIPLISIDRQCDSLQDNGIFFLLDPYRTVLT